MELKGRVAVANLDLASSEFFEKARLVVQDKDMPLQVPMRRFDEELRGEDGVVIEKAFLERYLFVLLNTSTSQRSVCQACNRYHWFRQQAIDLSHEKDRTGLCEECGYWLVNMTMLDVPGEEVKRWLGSRGEVNPAEVLREWVETLIKKGEMVVHQEPLDRHK